VLWLLTPSFASDSESAVVCPPQSMLIGARLDTDVHSNTCRLAFHGKILEAMDVSNKEVTQRLKVYKNKEREGSIERWHDDSVAVVKGLFKKETDIELFVGMQVVMADSGEVGIVEGSFGKSGKIKVRFRDPVADKRSGRRLIMYFKRYVFDQEKKMIQ